MILFTSHKCTRCREIHDVFVLQSLNIKEVVLTQENAEGLAELAWMGLVEEAQKSLPILVEQDGTVHTDVEKIVEVLAQRAKEVLSLRLLHTAAGPEAADVMGQAGAVCTDGTCRLS